MWELDYEVEHQRIDVFELWCWRRLLKVPWPAKSNQSILKKINPEYSLEALMLKLKLQYFGHLIRKNWLTGKDLDAGKDWRQKGTTKNEMVGWLTELDHRASPLQTYVPPMGEFQEHRSQTKCDLAASKWTTNLLDATRSLDFPRGSKQRDFFLSHSLTIRMSKAEFINANPGTAVNTFSFQLAFLTIFITFLIPITGYILSTKLEKVTEALKENTKYISTFIKVLREKLDGTINNIYRLHWKPMLIFSSCIFYFAEPFRSCRYCELHL